MTDRDLTAKGFALRRDVVEMIHGAGAGHIGGDLSVMDILVTLYCDEMNITPENFDIDERDHFIMSKGHNVEALYAILADRGFFPKEDLKTVSRFGSHYIGHPTRKIRGIEMNSGSLGHGLPVAVGMALAAKMDCSDRRIYVVMGDGELAEGSVWEGVMAAGHYKLDNIVLIIDRNHLQISGTTEVVMSQRDLNECLRGMGWNVLEAEGHDVTDLRRAFAQARKSKGTPTVIIARTTKGYGVSFIENKAGWHHKVPNETEYREALEELRQKEALCI